MSSERHRDGRSIYDFLGEALVVCPRCAHVALSRATDPASTDLFAPRRLTCDHCGQTRSSEGGSIRHQRRRAPALDAYFGLPVWLQARCCGELLWAYNTEHLAFLEAFVRARLRERRRSAKYGWSNQALISRLPAWLKSRRNRDEVLACIDRLRKTLA
jgi:hypothetical protein